MHLPKFCGQAAQDCDAPTLEVVPGCLIYGEIGMSLAISRDFEKWGDLAPGIEFVACNNLYIWTLPSFDLCMCNTAYNLKAAFPLLLF